MECPTCSGHVEMFSLEFERIEVDYCPGCKGIWLDAGELELIIETSGGQVAGLGDVLKVEGPTPLKGARHCCRCGKRMRKPTIDCGGGKSVSIDVCPKAHGLWLDDGELRTLIHGAGGPAAVHALSDYFGHLLGEDTPS